MACSGIDEFRKGVDISAEELFQPAVIKYIGHDFVLATKLLKYFFARDILSSFRSFGLFDDLHFTEQDIADLFRRSDVECFAGQFINSEFQFVHPSVECFGCFAQRLSVYTHAVHLHFRQDRNQRHLYFIEKLFYTELFQFRFQYVFQLQSDVGILRSVFINGFGRQFAHTALILSAGSDEFVYVDGSISEIHFGHIIHIVAKFRLDEVMRYHRIEKLTFECHVIMLQHL